MRSAFIIFSQKRTVESEPKAAEVEQPKIKPLRGKQIAFVEAYLATFNATEAARRAKYKGNDATLASVGWENLRKPEIAAAISQRLKETAMGADEVLMRLADQGRGSMADFVTIGDDGLPFYDLKKAEASKKLHLIRKLEVKRRTIHLGKPAEDAGNADAEDADEDEAEAGTIQEVTVKVELYDAQAAVTQLGRHHKLFTDKVLHDATQPVLDNAAALIAMFRAGQKESSDGADT